MAELIYIKFWRQACLPTLLYGTELFTLTPTLLAKVERCQQWFLKNVFYVPKFAPCQILLKLSGFVVRSQKAFIFGSSAHWR